MSLRGPTTTIYFHLKASSPTNVFAILSSHPPLAAIHAASPASSLGFPTGSSRAPWAPPGAESARRDVWRSEATERFQLLREGRTEEEDIRPR